MKKSYAIGFTLMMLLFTLLALLDRAQAKPRPSKRPVTNKLLDRLYRDYGMLLQNRCRKILHDKFLAEDALQETFYRALRYSNGRSFRKTKDKAFWLFMICDQVCHHMLEKDTPINIRSFEDVDDDEEEVDVPINWNLERYVELLDSVRKFLAKLVKKDREIFIYACFDELTQDEISQIKNCSREHINKRLKKILKKAQHFFGEFNAVNT